MRARGQGWIALGVVALIVVAGVAFDRLGPKAPAAAAAGPARSGAWYCPHGGGQGWRTVLSLANPGSTDVSARITYLGPRGSKTPQGVEIPAGTEVRQDVPSTDRGDATLVEYFGGWIAAGWTSLAGGEDVGVSAEPCASNTSATWFAADNTTQQDQDAFLVIMNPFDVPAVFDVALFTAQRAPIRDSDLTDVSLRAHRSIEVSLDAFAQGEEAVTAEVDVSSGRAVVASVGVSHGAGVRSALASPGTTTQSYLPVAAGTGQAQIAIGVPGEGGAQLESTLLTGGTTSPVQSLVGVAQDPLTARVYPLHTTGPSTAFVRSANGTPFVAALRSIGLGGDVASTGGAASVAGTWLVTPSVMGADAKPGLVLVNPGETSVTVMLHLVAPAGASPAADVSVTLPAASTVAAPPGFLASAPGAGVVVTAQGGGIVAMGASTSQVGGRGTYAFAMGVPVPTSNAG
jgi:hypothetical protein